MSIFFKRGTLCPLIVKTPSIRLRSHVTISHSLLFFFVHFNAALHSFKELGTNFVLHSAFPIYHLNFDGIIAF